MTTASNPIPTESSTWSPNELVPFGKYLLLDRVSVGSTAAVYRGKAQGEAGFERVLAVKRILPHMAGDQEFLKTFVQEAKTAARLSHTNICPIFELGKVGESFYMTMEYIAGKDLGRIAQRLLEKGKTVPPVAAAWIASKLCEALDYAHNLKNAEGADAGIYHRDLSPPNILVSYEGQVKLIDFGVAKAVGAAQQTNVDALKKKLSYMSPEMVQGRPIDQRSDVFGVGVCLYEMITAKKLFSGKDDLATLKMVSRASVPPPSAILEDPPEELEMVTMRALEREPEHRWQTADEMNNALKSFLAVENPTYGVRQLAQWMEEHFGTEMVEEQERLNLLLEASKQPEVLEQRKQYFSSLVGSAALAREGVMRRMSVEPPPDDALSGDAEGDPAAAPSIRAPLLSSEPPTSIEGYTEEIQELDDLQDLLEEVDEDEEEGGEPDDAATSFYDKIEQPGGGEPDDAATNFYDKTEELESAGVHALQPQNLLEPAYRYFEDVDEDATQIFFNKEDGVGLADLYERPDNMAGNLYAPAPGATSPLPPPPAVPPYPAPVSPTPPRRISPTPPGGRPQVAYLASSPAPGAWYKSGWMVAIVAGLVTVLASTALFLALRRPATASIEIRTVPVVQAKVLLDGIERGYTPMRMDGVPVGERLLEVRAPGYQPLVRKLTLSKGATAFLEISLKETVGGAGTVLPQTGPTPAPVPTPTGSTSGSPQPSTGSAETNTGTLVIDSEPWSRVFIDGKDTGLRTPIDSLRIEAGAHRIGMKTPDGKMHEESVNVVAGQSLKIIREFEYGQ